MVWWLDTSIFKEHYVSAFRVISAQDRSSMILWYPSMRLDHIIMTEIAISAQIDSKIGFEYMTCATSFVSA
jgi:hypothetical protein